MKTHTARWFQGGPGVWLLKERACDGGAVLAVIVESYGYGGGYGWRLGSSDTGTFAWSPTRYAAQRAVRKALANATS